MTAARRTECKWAERQQKVIRSAADDVAELLPARAAKGGELHLADRKVIVG